MLPLQNRVFLDFFAATRCKILSIAVSLEYILPKRTVPVVCDGMLSKTPIDLGKMGKEMLDMEILRVAIIAELDAINLYEEL